MFKVQSNHTTELISHMDNLEKEKHSLPMIFTEILKDEINANDELSIYRGIKELVEKYSKDAVSISIINELIKTLSGGASLDEIMQIAVDQMSYPYAVSDKASVAFFNLSLVTT